MQAAVPGNDDYFDILRLNGDGVTSEGDLSPTGNLYSGAYGAAINYFVNSGYSLNNELYIFPFDWRKDLNSTAIILDQKIIQIKQQTGAAKVDIVSHSMGGLVARNYISDVIRALNVRKIIELGTPHLGSVDYLRNLHYGGCIRFGLGPFCLSIAPSELKDVIQNMPGGFELLPSQMYYSFYSGNDSQHPIPFKDDRDIDSNQIIGPLNYSQTKSLLTNLGHNTNLFIPAENFHNMDNNYANTNGVDVTMIAGSGIATLGQIIEKYAINLFGIQIPKKDEVMINGDGTVPLFSASLDDPANNHSVKGTSKVYYSKQNHGGLAQTGPALDLIKNILSDNTNLPIGITSSPVSLKGKLVSVHSPINILITDSLNNQSGVNPEGDLINNIPGSGVETLDDSKFIWLPDDGEYNISFQATDEGSFDFKIRDFNNDQNDKTIIYQDIPLTNQTTGQTTLDTTNLDNPPEISLDNDNNGIVDATASATLTLLGGAAADQTPPVSTYQLNGDTQNPWFKNDVVVSLSAIDEASGSGILRVEYSIDNDNFQTYSNPFTISKEGITNLKIRSTDLAGNTEFPQSINIRLDKTPPEAKAQFNIANQAIEIIGTDNLTSVTSTENPSGQILLIDQAGNKTILTISPTTIPRNKTLFKTIQYNSDNTITLPSNELDATVRTNNKTGLISSLTQKIVIPNQTLSSSYDLKTNLTTITIGTKKQAQTETKPGTVLLQLLTNQGNLITTY